MDAVVRANRERRKPWAAPPTWGGLLFAAVGIFIVMIGVRLSQDESALGDHGRTVTGVIAGKSIGSSDSGMTYRIAYEFTVNGQPQHGSSSIALFDYQQAEVGQPVTITYLPERPSTNRLGRAAQASSPPTLLVMGGIGGLFTLLGVGMTISGLMRPRAGASAEFAPGTHRFKRSVMRVLVDVVFQPIGAVAFLGMAFALASGAFGGDPIARFLFVLPAFFGVLLALGSVASLRRGLGRTIFEVGPDGIWTPEMGRLAWDAIAEVRLESMRGMAGGDVPATSRYLRVGVVPKNPGLAKGDGLTRLTIGMTNGFFGFVKRLQPQARLAPADLAPFGVTDFEIEDSIDEVVDAVARYTAVIDQDARRAAERASRWTTAPDAAAVSSDELRVLDAGLHPAAAASSPSTGAPIAMVPPLPSPQPRATFRAPKMGLASLAIEGWSALSPIVLALVVTSVFLPSFTWSNPPIWILVPMLATPVLIVIVGVRRVSGLVKRWRSGSSGDRVRLVIGPDGVWLPEMGRTAWADVRAIGTERAGLSLGSEGTVEHWRLTVVPGGGANVGRTFGVDAEALDAPFDDVLDLIRIYHPVTERG